MQISHRKVSIIFFTPCVHPFIWEMKHFRREVIDYRVACFKAECLPWRFNWCTSFILFLSVTMSMIASCSGVSAENIRHASLNILLAVTHLKIYPVLICWLAIVRNIMSNCHEYPSFWCHFTCLPYAHNYICINAVVLHVHCVTIT